MLIKQKDSYWTCCECEESVVHTETRKMKLQYSLLYLCVVLSTALADDTQPKVVDPRGTRPVEHGYKPDSCSKEKEWPICMDDDWGRKCPSGCRIQGILDKTDEEFKTKIDKIRKLLDEGRKMYRSADQVSRDTHTYLRERLVTSSDADTRYASLAEQLRQRIVDMKIKIDRQLKMLEALKAQIKTQVITMQRMEVDIDIKLRSCKGSCAGYAGFSVDKESYVALDKQIDRLDSMRVQSVETVSSLKVLKSRPMKDVIVPTIYKSGLDRAEQKQAIFPDVGQLQLSLEAEGSTTDSAATVSKVTTVCESVHSPKRHNPYGHQRRHRQCSVNKYSLCTDEEVEKKCPSSCRLQSLIDKTEEDISEKLSKICHRTHQYNRATSSMMFKSVQFYNAQRKIIVKTHRAELRYAEIAQRLHSNLALLWDKSIQLTRKLQMCYSQTLEQITEMQRSEVDIDIKLHTCRGSCKQTFDLHTDHEVFKDMEDEMDKFALSLVVKQKTFPKTQELKLQPVVRPPISLAYRNIPFVRSKLLTKFEDIEQNQVVLDKLLEEIKDLNSAGYKLQRG